MFQASRLLATRKSFFLGTRFISTTAKFTPSSRGGPLDGIRVLDLTRVLAGPYCTMMLGDLGADVIKIENPQGGDDTRGWGPPFAKNKDKDDSSSGESAYFLCVNRNKRSVTVNIKTEQGQELLKELVKKSDVLVENYLPGKLDKLGLGYAELKKINPRLIYASITGYGQTGPYSSKPGYDVVIEAEAGLMHITGEQSGNPVKVGVAITDLTTGLYAHSAILASLFQRSATGKGQHVDCSLLESQVASLANIGSNFLVGGKEAKRMGTSHPSIVPYQVFPTRDSFVMIGTGNDGQFNKLCRCMNLSHLPEDSRFKKNIDRVNNRKELVQLITDRLKQEDSSYWLEKLNNAGFPFAPINNIKQTFDHPQIKARGLVQEVDHPRAGRVSMVGPPVKYSEAKTSIRIPPPTLGEHTHQVLEELLGYKVENIKALEKKGAIGVK